ncbi:MAG: hypothetical protein BroJett011_53820 [Chloroflexota bacterium]|nr:MAG: hypothetical protein BroJett011_53820 [Chloroflexota bacterium]
MIQFPPEVLHFQWVFAKQQGGIRMSDAISDEAIGGQVSMGAGVAISRQPGVGIEDDARRTPMRYLVGAIGNLTAGDRHMEDKSFNLGYFHADAPPFSPII